MANTPYTKESMLNDLRLIGELGEATWAERYSKFASEYPSFGTWIDGTANKVLREDGKRDPKRYTACITAWLLMKDSQGVLTPKLAYAIADSFGTEVIEYLEDIPSLVRTHNERIAKGEEASILADANGENLKKLDGYTTRGIKEADSQLSNGADPDAVAARLEHNAQVMLQKAADVRASNKALVTA